MKKLFTIIILIFACQNLIFAQEEAISVEDLVAATIVDSAVAIVEENNDIATDNSPRLKLNWNQKKQIRKQADADYFAWERKYFNSPGKWYMSIGGGYGFPFLTTEPELVPPLFFLGNSNLEINKNGTSLNKALLSGQGGGGRLNLTVGKMFNRFVGFEMVMGYFMAKKDNLSTINRPNYYSELNTDLTEISFTPSVVFQSPNMKNFYVYGKIGPYIPFWGNPRAKAYINDREGVYLSQGGIFNDPFLEPLLKELLETDFGQGLLDLTDFRTEVRADVKIILQQNIDEFSLKEIARAIGGSASMGFKYQATPIVSLFGEVGVKGYNISLAKIVIEDLDAKLTLFNDDLTVLTLNENGANILGNEISPGALTSTLETNYVNELNENSNNPKYNGKDYSTFRPRDELAPRLSIVTIAFNVGLQFNFPGRGVYYRPNSRKAKK